MTRSYRINGSFSRELLRFPFRLLGSQHSQMLSRAPPQPFAISFPIPQVRKAVIWAGQQ